NKTVKVDVRVIAATNKNLEQAISRGEFREDLYYRLRVFPLQMPPLRERGTDILLMLDHFTKKFHGDYALAPMQFDSSARKILLAYRWPGNVRELRNFVERMLIMYSGQVVTAAMLPAEILAATGKNADNAIANSAYNNTFAAANAGSIGGAGNTGGTTDESSASAYCAGAKANAAELDTGVLPKALCENDFKAARAEFEARYLEEKLKEFDGNISKMAEAIKIERSYLHRKLKALGITE
ncbi:sigma 54-interacting transcriptional regulator, partial [Desulfovibrio sp. OttesenSCG-928-F07]|nr:sigma 54-interacting transcriptional regulator [Desulfovibrio sp. OttesenSCG-928-F07]